jgi:tRNA nucleotidyltransferase/poly(A) polymerase
MFYDPLRRRVIDYVGGRDDLRRGVIRTIGKPQERLSEDYLRMLRAVRFAVRLGFDIHPATARAIRQNAAAISQISGERICDELTRMLSAPSAVQALEQARRLGLAEAILPELFAPKALWNDALARVRVLAGRKDFILTAAALLAELPEPAIRGIVRRWGAPNELRDALCFLAGHLPDWHSAGDMPLCDFKRLMACEHFDRLRRLWRVQERLAGSSQRQSRRIAGRAAAIPPRAVNPPPFITGDDLKRMGLGEGQRLGAILRAVRDAQLNECVRSRPEALAWAREMIRDS